jgi:uncharacterized protein (DUF697 family)
MNKKKLPKAILQTSDAFPPAGSAIGPNELRPTPRMGWSDSGNETGSQKVQGISNVVPITPAAQNSSLADRAVPSSPAVPLLDSDSSERRRKALTIVNRHAAYAAAGGLIPVPLANFAGVTAVVVRMVKVLSAHYGVPFQRDRARAIVVGLIGGVIPSGAATLTGSALFSVLPPSILAVAAVSSVTAAAFTHSVGRIFIEHFECGATLDEFPTAETRSTART